MHPSYVAGSGLSAISVCPAEGTPGTVESYRESGVWMNKITAYLAHADECRRMARLATEETHREALLRMAHTWTELAASRAEGLARKKRIDDLPDTEP